MPRETDKLQSLTSIDSSTSQDGTLNIGLNFNFLDVRDDGYSKLISSSIKLQIKPFMNRKELSDALKLAAQQINQL